MFNIFFQIVKDWKLFSSKKRNQGYTDVGILEQRKPLAGNLRD